MHKGSTNNQFWSQDLWYTPSIFRLIIMAVFRNKRGQLAIQQLLPPLCTLHLQIILLSQQHSVIKKGCWILITPQINNALLLF